MFSPTNPVKLSTLVNDLTRVVKRVTGYVTRLGRRVNTLEFFSRLHTAALAEAALLASAQHERICALEATVAQLVEHRNARVGGSNPSGATTYGTLA